VDRIVHIGPILFVKFWLCLAEGRRL